MAATDYKLTTMPRADDQVRDLLHRAPTMDIRDALIHALRTTVADLRMKPGQIGDPLHKTRKKGGMVYGKVIEPVFVRFAVFEADRNVFLLEVLARKDFENSDEEEQVEKVRKIWQNCVANEFPQLITAVKQLFDARIAN